MVYHTFKEWMESNTQFDVKIGRFNLYHGTSGNFDQFDISMAGERDFGDFGLGVYLTASSGLARSYASDAAQRNKSEPVILRVENRLQRTVNFDDPQFRQQVTQATGAIFPQSGDFGRDHKGGSHTRPQEETKAITNYVTSLGYDSAMARNGHEIIAYDIGKLKIVDRITLDRWDSLI